MSLVFLDNELHTFYRHVNITNLPDNPTANTDEHAPGAYAVVKVRGSPSASVHKIENTVVPEFVFSGTLWETPRFVKTGLLLRS